MTVSIPLLEQHIHLFSYFSFAIFSCLDTRFKRVYVSNFDSSVSDRLLELVLEIWVLKKSLLKELTNFAFKIRLASKSN